MALNKKKILEVVGLCILTSSALGSYEVARPAAESLFLSTYGRDMLPWAWLGVAAFAALVVSIYNRFSSWVPLTKLFVVSSAISAGMLVALQFLVRANVGWAPFAMYLWKDVYVVVLVEIFWSFANLVYPVKSARWLYGLFCACGSLGSALCTRLFRWYVVTNSTADYDATLDGMWLVVPLLVLSCLSVAFVSMSKGEELSDSIKRELENAALRKQTATKSDGLWQGFGVLRKSSYLTLILVLVIVMQLVSVLVDYRFNGLVESEFSLETDRTVMISTVYEYIAYGALIMQVLSGVILRFLGVTKTLIFIPLLTCATVLALAINPVFIFGAIAKVVGKVLDYSLSRTSKEMIYIPLTYEEKTQGKAIVDILGYRVAKGLGSVLLIGLIAFDLSQNSSWIAIGLLMVWIVIAIILASRYRTAQRAFNHATRAPKSADRET